MTSLRIVLIVCAVLFAGVAAYLITALRPQPKPVLDMPDVVAPPQAASAVLVVAQFVARGAVLSATDVRWQDWPRSAIPDGAIERETKDAPPLPPAGHRARGDFFPGEVVLASKLINPADSGLLAASLGPGMRAVAARISPELGAGGFILPGDRVDVIVTMRTASDTGAQVTISTTALRDVRVLAIDQEFGTEDGKTVLVGQTATLELTPGQAERLALAREQGKLSFSLRAFDQPDAGLERAVPKPQALALYRYGIRSDLKASAP